MLDFGVWWWCWVWWLGGYSSALGCCNGWGREVVWQGRENNVKKLFTRWTVTVYICTVTVHFARRRVYIDIFTWTDVEEFWGKMCKLEPFLYFRWVYTGWCGCSKSIDSLDYLMIKINWKLYVKLKFTLCYCTSNIVANQEYILAIGYK